MSSGNESANHTIIVVPWDASARYGLDGFSRPRAGGRQNLPRSEFPAGRIPE
jgi:hypothetical protein